MTSHEDSQARSRAKISPSVNSSSPTVATSTIQFLLNPVEDDTVELAGVSFVYKDAPSADPLDREVATRHSITYAVSTLVDALNAFTVADPGSPVSDAAFTQVSFDTMLIETVDPGAPEFPYGVAVLPAVQGTALATVSSTTLVGGVDFDAFASPASPPAAPGASARPRARHFRATPAWRSWNARLSSGSTIPSVPRARGAGRSRRCRASSTPRLPASSDAARRGRPGGRWRPTPRAAPPW